MITQKCPKCGSKRIRRGYRPTSIFSKAVFRFNLLCDTCNWEFTGFAIPIKTDLGSDARKQDKIVIGRTFGSEVAVSTAALVEEKTEASVNAIASDSNDDTGDGVEREDIVTVAAGGQSGSGTSVANRSSEIAKKTLRKSKPVKLEQKSKTNAVARNKVTKSRAHSASASASASLAGVSTKTSAAADVPESGSQKKSVVKRTVKKRPKQAPAKAGRKKPINKR